jgi:hypothetical protein
MSRIDRNFGKFIPDHTASDYKTMHFSSPRVFNPVFVNGALDIGSVRKSITAAASGNITRGVKADSIVKYEMLMACIGNNAYFSTCMKTEVAGSNIPCLE